MEAVITCPKCNSSLISRQNAGEFLVPINTGEMERCYSCGTKILLEVFPALFRPVAAANAGEIAVSAEESTCFYHPKKKAVVPCDGCGRFLCALCDVELNGSHLCPNCISSGRKKGKLRNLDNERVLYDRIALAVAIIPILFIWATIIAAPITIFLCIRYWNSPASIVRGPARLRFIIAILIALAEIGGWITVAILVFNSHSRA
jgi:ssDNA-binding Zn-finger/Zn-ribbon topoisomerase 1